MSAASNSESRKRLAIVPDPPNALALIHEFESAVVDLGMPGDGVTYPVHLARRDRALDALLVAMGEPALYGTPA